MRERVPLRLLVNGAERTASVDGRTSLRDCLHEALACKDVKQGCAEGVCGACVVMIDGVARASCLELAINAEGTKITTAGGLGGDLAWSDAHERLRAQVLAREAFQCGYCAPGFMVEATAYIAGGGSPDRTAIREALAGHLCRCTGYHQIIEAIAAAAANEPVPPTVLRPDLAEKVDGSAGYPTDTAAETPAIARIVWSDHPAARIDAIDPAAALAVPGVLRVLTWRDIPGQNIAAENIFGDDQPLLARDRVRCSGDAVAVVIAESDAAAREGAGRLAVTYTPERPVLGIDDALASDAPDIGGYRNTIAQFTEARGDVDAAFAAAEIVVEGEYRSGINDHICMEPEGGVGSWDGHVLELTVATHNPHAVRAGIAKALSLAQEQIRIRTPRMGGAFGKYLVPGVDSLLALAAFQCDRPVRLVLDRGEIIARRAKRHPFLGRYKLGMTRAGKFLALDADVFTDSGPYVSITPTVVSVFADEICGAYAFEAVRARARGVLTNNLPSSPMRGFGSQQINFGIEAIVQKACREAKLDPIEIRRANFDRTKGDAAGQRSPVSPSPLDLTLDRVAAQLGPPLAAMSGHRVGRGIATVKCKYGFPYGFVDRFVVRVGIDRNGEFFVDSDLPDSGTGALAGVARLVADELGLARLPRSTVSQRVIDDPTGIEVSSGRAPTAFRRWLFRLLERLQGIQASKAMSLVVRMNTRTESRIMKWFARPINWVNGAINWLKSRVFPYSIDSFLPRAGSSRAMYMIGNAALDATRDLRRAIEARAKKSLATDTLVWHFDGVTGAGRRLSWRELATDEILGIGRASLPRGRLITPGSGNQVGCVDHMFATHAVDVAVEEATGRVKVLRWIAAQDVGKVLNATTVRGQIYGSIAMGLGQATLEHVDLRTGAVANASMHDYLIPTMLDVPEDPIIELVESGEGAGPGGAKGVGEASAVVAPIAIAHAIYDATGIQFDITMTPEQIAGRLQEKGAQDGAGRQD